MEQDNMAEQAISSPSADDLTEIRRAALDYMQGWYEGDAERMRRSLHPELAKRAILWDEQTGGQRFHHVNQQLLVAKTQEGGGSDTPSEKRTYDTVILDVYGDIACARAESYEYVDYLQLARTNGRWVIVNVLFALKPIP